MLQSWYSILINKTWTVTSPISKKKTYGSRFM